MGKGVSCHKTFNDNYCNLKYNYCNYCNDLLSLDAEKTEVCIANTHLLYNPNRGDIKLAQLGVILNKIQNTVSRPSAVPHGTSGSSPPAWGYNRQNTTYFVVEGRGTVVRRGGIGGFDCSRKLCGLNFMSVRTLEL